MTDDDPSLPRRIFIEWPVGLYQWNEDHAWWASAWLRMVFGLGILGLAAAGGGFGALVATVTGQPTDPWFWGGVTVVIGGFVILAFVLLYGWLVAAIGGRE